jgi:hypothetical protein
MYADRVDALAIAWWAATHQPVATPGIPQRVSRGEGD